MGDGVPGKGLILNNSKYELTAVRPDQYPAGNLPEVAFSGRSNAGKSSAINALLNRRNLARVAATPGKTREINFYNVDGKLYLVDLPGYGYAKVSREKKLSWGAVVDTYLHSRRQLKLVVLLVDIRHTPSEDDRVMYHWLAGHGMPHIIAASKADKLPRSQVAPRLADIRKAFGMESGAALIPFSAESGQGRDEVWAAINAARAF
jgi:GTP-binding protein